VSEPEPSENTTSVTIQFGGDLDTLSDAERLALIEAAVAELIARFGGNITAADIMASELQAGSIVLSVTFFPRRVTTEDVAVVASNISAEPLVVEDPAVNISFLSAGADAVDVIVVHDVNLAFGTLKTVNGTIFNAQETATILRLNNNELTDINSQSFASLTVLQNLFLQFNLLSRLPRDVFASNTMLTRLNLHGNALKTVSVDLFVGLSALEELQLGQNELSTLPATIFRDTTSLVYLDLHENAIVQLPTGLFAGLSQLVGLFLNGNLLAALPGRVFQGLGSIQIIRLHNNSLAGFSDTAVTRDLHSVRSLSLQWNRITQIHPDALAHLSAVPSIVLSPNPLTCSFNSSGRLTCTGCESGYVFNAATNSCDFPLFGPSDLYDPAADENVFGDISAGATTIFAGVAYSQAAPDFAPKSAKFQGYSNGRFDQIQFQIDIDAVPLNISCGDVVRNTTRGQPDLFGVANGDFNADNPFFGPERLYAGGEGRFMFEVARDGAHVTFDTCLSDFSTSIAVWMVDSGHASTLVFPSEQRTIEMGTVTFANGSVVPLSATAIFPHEGGCGGSSLNARVQNLSLAAGVYVVVIESGAVWDIRSEGFGGAIEGDFVLKMVCTDAADSVLPPERRLGLRVDPDTGAIAGTPQVQGVYNFSVSAVDALSGAKSVMRQWSVNVTENTFRLKSGTTFAMEPPLPDFLALNWTHRFAPKPAPGHSSFRPTDFFVDFAVAVYFRLDLRVVSGVVSGPAIMSRTESAFIQAIPTEGFTTVFTLVAVDGAGQEIILVNKTVQALPPGLWIDPYGPNGQGCNGGVRVQITGLFANNHTCKCDGLRLTGDNCETAVETVIKESTDRTGTITAASAAALVFVLAVAALGWKQYQLHKARNTPQDFGELQSEVMSELGLSESYDIGVDEVGLTFVMETIPVASFDEVEASLRSALQKGVKVVRGSPIEWSSARFSKPLHERPHEMLGVVSRPARIDSGEPLFEVVDAAVVKGRLYVCDCRVVGVNLRIPRRVPKEISRKAFVRHEMIGGGAFGEVYIGEVQEHALLPKYPVAAKTLRLSEDAKDSDADAQRDDLLKEATLQALLVHDHIVQVVGVITIPNNIPPFVLLEYCERGTLESFVREGDHEVELLLSLLGDAASGLEYLNTHCIVHRDCAARNVLLSQSMAAKVSDFGLAKTIGESGHHHSRKSMSVLPPAHFQSPDFTNDGVIVRWAAPEVLRSRAYTQASDVWAFGMTILEVFSRDVPYADLEDNKDVWKAVARGLVPSKPHGCPTAVYERLMRVCWYTDPHQRPTFAELRELTTKLGGDSSSGADGKGRTTEWDRLQRVHDPSYFSTPEGRKFLGVSVNHLVNKFYPAVVKACAPPYARNDGLTIDPSDAKIFDAVAAYVKPRTAGIICPIDGQRGCSYVSSLRHVDDVGPASALLSYSWGYEVKAVTAALAGWCNKNTRDPKRTRVWICSLCLNQHRIIAKLSPAELGRTFGERVERIGRIAPMLNTWKGNDYVSRAWCLFELFTAIQNRDVAIDIVLPPTQRTEFLQSIKQGGYGAVDDALSSIKSEEAQATVEDDLLAIKAIVEELPGQYAMLNRTVRTHLHAWFEEHGLVQSASRVAGYRGGSSHGLTSSAIGWSKGSSNMSAHGSRATSAPMSAPAETVAEPPTPAKPGVQTTDMDSVDLEPESSPAQSDTTGDAGQVRYIEGEPPTLPRRSTWNEPAADDFTISDSEVVIAPPHASWHEDSLAMHKSLAQTRLGEPALHGGALANVSDGAGANGSEWTAVEHELQLALARTASQTSGQESRSLLETILIHDDQDGHDDIQVSPGLGLRPDYDEDEASTHWRDFGAW